MRMITRHHGVTEMPLIPNDSEVWVTSLHQTKGPLVSAALTPRSYLIETLSGIIQRNKQHLRIFPKASNTESQQTPVVNDADNHQLPVTPQSTRSSRIMTCSQTGTTIVPPVRYQT